MLARLRKSIKEKDAGFTLVELLVVMIIIGILAAIAIPVFLNQRKKAVDTSIKSDLRSVATSVETAFVDSQAYPTQTAWTLAGTSSSQTGVVVPEARTTPNNKIEYKVVTGGFCLRGSSANATTGLSSFYFYESPSGGLQAGDPAAAKGLCTA
jgi:type IV pilus assembly protein PilA